MYCSRHVTTILIIQYSMGMPTESSKDNTTWLPLVRFQQMSTIYS